MKKILLALLVVFAAASVANAAPYGNDVLGAHNGYGRGCVMCHAPHSGSQGNGVTSSDTQNGMYALWGQNLTPLFGYSTSFSGDGSKTKYPVTLPASGTITSAEDANTLILFCLNCHDGVTSVVGMMQGVTVEPLPIVGGTAPTLLAKAAPTAGWAYANDHPVGGYAYVSCGAPADWDCSGGGNTNTPITMSGTNSAAFLKAYPGSFWNLSGNPLASFNNGAVVNAVTCTTCHDQHSMTAFVAGNGTTYTSMFFVKGNYQPLTGGNSVAQFCRNCHGAYSNESHGVYGVPTT
jgi:cytochrome c5